MKKLLISTVALMTLFATNLQANAELLNKSDYARLEKIGNRLITANQINKRFTFNFTSIGQQGAYPIIFDTSYSNDMNLHNNRTVSMYFADYLRLSSDDEVAALIAHDLAQGLHSYTGVLNGQFMFTKNGCFPFNYIAKRNELNFDKQAIDFLVKAGYNPKALETALNKTTGEWRGTFWGRHNKTSVRVKKVNRYIDNKYSQKI